MLVASVAGSCLRTLKVKIADLCFRDQVKEEDVHKVLQHTKNVWHEKFVATQALHTEERRRMEAVLTR